MIASSKWFCEFGRWRVRNAKIMKWRFAFVSCWFSAFRSCKMRVTVVSVTSLSAKNIKQLASLHTHTHGYFEFISFSCLPTAAIFHFWFVSFFFLYALFHIYKRRLRFAKLKWMQFFIKLLQKPDTKHTLCGVQTIINSLKSPNSFSVLERFQRESDFERSSLHERARLLPNMTLSINWSAISVR